MSYPKCSRCGQSVQKIDKEICVDCCPPTPQLVTDWEAMCEDRDKDINRLDKSLTDLKKKVSDIFEDNCKLEKQITEMTECDTNCDAVKAVEKHRNHILDRLKAEQSRSAKMLGYLKRYNTETPLGNQPHMIAEEVETFIIKIECDKAIAEKGE